MPRHLFQVTVNLPGSFRNNINNNDIFNPYVFVRNRLYHFLFHRFALGYARVFSEFHRQLMEFFILLAALFSFILLVYVHVVFVQSPITCLENYRDVFRRADILRVEVLSGKRHQNYTLLDSYFKEKAIRLQYFESQGRFIYSEHVKREDSEEFYPFDEDEEVGYNESISDPDAFKAFTLNSETLRADSVVDTVSTDDIQESPHLEPELEVSVEEESFQTLSEASILGMDPNEAYIMEFSLEYGYLRLRPSKRHDLNITVVFVVLDPEEDTCFGGPFNRFLLDNFLGYDNFLLGSIKHMAEKKSTKGFVRNAVMELEYIFINNWVNDRSFFTAGFVMIVFTLTISALLRHSHHQIFVVVGYWMQHIISTLERRSNIFDAVWPRNFIPTSGAPVLTVILALVGMEAVMSDFFHDRTIALHIIVVVWFADIYDAVCCQSPLSKRHWYKFFYLYHFLFYAYNYKFTGVYWRLSLTVSWLFIFHSMVFFFHHYELPRFLHRAAMFQATRNANNRRASRSHGRRNHSSPNNNNSSNNNNNNQESTNELIQPPDLPEIENLPNGSEINQPDEQQPTENLVNEEVVSAAGYDSLSQSEADTESKNSEMKCCDVCHSLQIDSEVHTCLKENPTTSESAAEENSLESNSESVECHQKANGEVESFENFSGHQTCEHGENEFSDGGNAENFPVEGIFKEKEMFGESNIEENAEKQENVVRSRDVNDLYSRELSVD